MFNEGEEQQCDQGQEKPRPFERGGQSTMPDRLMSVRSPITPTSANAYRATFISGSLAEEAGGRAGLIYSNAKGGLKVPVGGPRARRSGRSCRRLPATSYYEASTVPVAVVCDINCSLGRFSAVSGYTHRKSVRTLVISKFIVPALLCDPSSPISNTALIV
jgi:hypothetical protein